MAPPLVWRPILTGDVAAQALAVVQEVARALTYLARLGPSDERLRLPYEDAALACLEYAMDVVNDHLMTESLYAGFRCRLGR